MPTVPSLEEFDYVLRDERDLPESKRTTFRLRPLRYKEREECERLEWRDDPNGPVLITESLKVARKTLNAGLIGWTGLKDSAGNEIKFERNGKGIKEGLLDLIAPWANELANAITRGSSLAQDEAKNL